MWLVYLKGWNWLTIIIGLLQVARQGVGRAYALAVCIKSGIAPEPPVVGGGLRTGCSGYQERVAQNRDWLAGGLELGVAVTRSGWPRTPIGWWEPPRGPERSPRAGGPEPPLCILLPFLRNSEFI